MTIQWYCNLSVDPGEDWCGLLYVYLFPVYITFPFVFLVLLDKLVFRKDKLVSSRAKPIIILIAVLDVIFLLLAFLGYVLQLAEKLFG